MKLTKKKLQQILFQSEGVFIILIIWSVFGFISNLDNSMLLGCVGYNWHFYHSQNIIYSFISLLLLSIGFFANKFKLTNGILILELIYWIYKLFFIKGGYIVGYGGIPNLHVVSYDFIALTLRLILIKKVSKFNFPTHLVLFLVITIIFFRVKNIFI